jgi:glycolate oxidase FAD binding subunit
LGLTVVLASGERVRCGGRVVKNVTGYDLNKLYSGSLGSLGVIESAWLRLRAAPERSTFCEVETESVADACRCAHAAARCISGRAVALKSARAGGWRVVVELAGDGLAVEHDLVSLRSEFAANDASVEAIDRIRDAQAKSPLSMGLRFRLGVLPTRLEWALSELRAAGASLLAYPRLQLVFADFGFEASEPEGQVDEVFRTLESIARRAGGSYVCESAPASVKSDRDMFGNLGASAPIVRALKLQFDPTGVLNPGRFAGRI